MTTTKSVTLLSIIIPAYNYAHLIERALNSVFNQWNENIEVIVIDDGSTDNTQQVLTSYQRQLNRPLTLINQHNTGVAKARNNAIDAATGRYVWLLDADDELAENSIAAVLKYLAENQPELLLGSHVSVKPDGKRKTLNRKPASDNRLENFIAYLDKTMPMMHGAFVVKRALIQRYPYPEDLSHAEDIPVFAWLVANTNPQIITDALVNIHKHANSRRHNSSAAVETGMQLVDTLFDSKYLSNEYLAYKDWYKAYRVSSLFRTCYAANDYQQAKELYAELFKLSPRRALRWKTLRKRIRMIFKV
jgi:glycosyltransferase involved in cell wall biosynthesis